MKPDQLIKRRGKLGLVKVNTNLDGVKEFINSHMLKDIQVGRQQQQQAQLSQLFSYNDNFLISVI